MWKKGRGTTEMMTACHEPTGSPAWIDSISDGVELSVAEMAQNDCAQNGRMVI
jgi:hypothetical protein